VVFCSPLWLAFPPAVKSTDLVTDCAMGLAESVIQKAQDVEAKPTSQGMTVVIALMLGELNTARHKQRAQQYVARAEKEDVQAPRITRLLRLDSSVQALYDGRRNQSARRQRVAALHEINIVSRAAVPEVVCWRLSLRCLQSCLLYRISSLLCQSLSCLCPWSRSPSPPVEAMRPRHR
jgi:hypothetical protein